MFANLDLNISFVRQTCKYQVATWFATVEVYVVPHGIKDNS